MKAKNKKEFLEQLDRELSRIGIEDTKDIFADFEEHFADSAIQGISEEETAERLGDVKEIARSYLNLESSRINSIVARDVEHKKGVSLTKPGRSVPADLSLLKGRDAMNSDCVRSYTPEHLSEEIYPNAANSTNGGGNNGNGNNFSGNPDIGFNSGAGGNADVNSNGMGGSYGYAQGGAGASAAGGQTVAGAFSNAGRAALDAAKITGQALADAFGQSGVKDAVVGAGKSAAEAVKTAGHSAAEAMRKAKDEHERQQAQHAARQAENAARQADGVPRPNDSFRENVNSNRAGTIPPQYKKAKTSGNGYKMIDASDMKVNINVGKFILALVLDCFVWSWLIPAFGSLITGGFFGGALGLIGEAFKAVFGMGSYHEFYFLSRVFVTIGHLALVVILVNIGIMLVRVFINLFKFIINMHIRAIYDL